MRLFWIGSFIIVISIASINLYGIFSETTISPVEQEKEVVVQEDKKEEKKEVIDGKWVLEFHDDFNYLDFTKWNIENIGEGYNNELQYYKYDNVVAKDGELHLLGLKEQYKNHQYTSGKITTKDKFEFKYGKVEITLRTDLQQGSFPAVWLLPVDGKKIPEVDIFEAVGKEKGYMYYVNHYKVGEDTKRDFSKLKITNPTGFHKYAIEWNKNEIRWYVDDKLIHVTEEGVPNEPMYLIINLAIGGDWPGNPDETTKFPMEFVIDDIKIMKEM